MTTELAIVTQDAAIAAFTGGLDAAIRAIEDQARATPVDISTKQGRAAWVKRIEVEATAERERAAAALRKAEIERAEAESRAERDRKNAEQARINYEADRAEIAAAEKQAAIEAERAQIAAEQKAKADTEAKRIANIKHRERIEWEAVRSLLQFGYDQTFSELLISLIRTGKITHVEIKY